MTAKATRRGARHWVAMTTFTTRRPKPPPRWPWLVGLLLGLGCLLILLAATNALLRLT